MIRHFPDAEQRPLVGDGDRDAHDDVAVGSQQPKRQVDAVLVELLWSQALLELLLDQGLVAAEGGLPIDEGDLVALAAGSQHGLGGELIAVLEQGVAAMGQQGAADRLFQQPVVVEQAGHGAKLATAGIDAGIVDPVREMQIDPFEEGGDVGDHGIEGQKEGRYAFGWWPLRKTRGQRVAEQTGLLIGAGDGIERDEPRDVGGRARQQPGAAFMKTVTAEEARKEGAAELNFEVATLLLQVGYVLCILLGQQDVEPLATIGAQCLGQWLRIE